MKCRAELDRIRRRIEKGERRIASGHPTRKRKGEDVPESEVIARLREILESQNNATN